VAEARGDTARSIAVLNVEEDDIVSTVGGVRSFEKVREVIFDERSEELMGRKRTTRLLGDNNPPEFRII